MNTAPCLLILLVLAVAHTKPIAPGEHPSTTLRKFAFGSCNKHDKPQPLWDHINKYNPELWVWLGDIVYADTREMPFVWHPSAISVMAYKYDVQKNNPGYKELVENVNITGVWDDHDYGMNNGGAFYQEKQRSQKLILEFLEEPAESERWKREGLYTSFTFGENDKKVKLIVLDTRYFRDDPFLPGSDILGTQQWEWLEKELKESDAKVHIFASSVQLIPADVVLIEKWSNFQIGRDKFLQLLLKYKVATPIILSGDVHHSELFHYNCPESSLVVDEITSSGMTHCCASTFPSWICNLVLDTLMHSRFSLGAFDGFNYGTVEINWDTNPPTVDLQVRGEDGEIIQRKLVIIGDTRDSGTDVLCTENIPFYVYWSPTTWFWTIVSILLAILIGILYCIIVLLKKLRQLFRRTSKKKE